MVALHRGEIGVALSTWPATRSRSSRGTTPPGGRGTPPCGPRQGCWPPCPTDVARLDRARFIVRENPIAAAIVDRADAIDIGDPTRSSVAAAALDAAGCRYQRARTLVFAAAEARAEGEAILAAIGAAPMAEPA